MKKTSLYFAAAVVVLLSSCAKQYDCVCTTNDGYVTHNTIAEGSEEESAAGCEEMEYTHTSEVGGQTFVTTNTCELQ